uniref:G_PROTEIN_RECEP_F1_2 domain-containing protein n=1 Tax=Syphacia muris TaxID=451379 RepID=A0A0N5ATW1_9BILA
MTLKYDKEKYRRGTGVALWTLAASDLCAIILTAIQNLMFVTPIPDYTDRRLWHIFCKAILFSTHASTGISIWSWLLLSTLRYLAVRHPLYHLRLWRMPYSVIAFVICTSIGVNGFLLVTIVATFTRVPAGTYVECMEAPVVSQTLILSFHALEIIWSFCLPFAMIVFMDASVVLKGVTSPTLLSNFKRRNRALRTKHHAHALRSWLTIAVICILLNTPQNFINCMRLLQASVFETSLLNYVETTLNPFFRAFEIVAQAFYFGQFGFNAVYLVLFVFDKLIKPRNANKEQISTNTSRATSVNSHKGRFHTGPLISNGYLGLKQSSI